MNRRLLFTFALMGVAALAGTKSYTFTLYGPTMVGNVELQAGSYKLDVGEQKALIHYGKQTTEVPVKVETSDSKYRDTTLKISNDNGRRRVEEIHLGGTKTKLVLTENTGPSAGQ